jgi:hypothetical protein
MNELICSDASAVMTLAEMTFFFFTDASADMTLSVARAFFFFAQTLLRT